jgi:hypothetical protein
MATKKSGGKWIQKAVGKNVGGLHKSLGVKPGVKIPKSKITAAAKKGGKVGKQARLALTLGKFKKKGK